MNFKKLVLSFTLASAAILGTGAARAVCTYSGPVEEVYTDGTTIWVYVSPPNSHAVPLYVYFFKTTNGEIAETINGSLHKNVTISGTGVCPTSGPYRYGGVASSIYVN